MIDVRGRSLLQQVDSLRVDAGGSSRERAARAAWMYLAEPGDGTAGLLVSALGAGDALELVSSAADAGEVAQVLIAQMGASGDEAESVASAVAEGMGRWRTRIRPDTAEEALAGAAGCGARLTIPGDRCWPQQVDDLGIHAPLGLWVRGDPAALRGTGVAIVGSRAASPYGEQVAVEFASGLADFGLTVVSGAAYGIDGHAHRAALASGGRTIALLAGGVDRLYPKGHADLLERIAREGAVVSERPCGSAPTKWRFLSRNRVIAAVSSASVVIEAGWRSGSLNTAHHAATLARPVGAVPGPVTSPSSVGCHRLLREAAAVCVTSADDVAELIGVDTHQRDEPSLRTPEETRILDALSSRTARSVDAIAARSGLAAEQVRSVIGLLEVCGEAREDNGGWVLASVSR